MKIVQQTIASLGSPMAAPQRPPSDLDKPESLGQVASNTVTGTLVAPTSGALKRAAIQLFVAARHDDWRSRCVAEVRLRQVVRDLLAAPVDDERDAHTGDCPLEH
jgi:hypothetical protein